MIIIIIIIIMAYSLLLYAALNIFIADVVCTLSMSKVQ